MSYRMCIYHQYNIIINLRQDMNIRFNWLFKFACASMLAGTTLGAKYGHAGQLSEEGAPLFVKAQIYNISNSTFCYMQVLG